MSPELITLNEIKNKGEIGVARRTSFTGDSLYTMKVDSQISVADQLSIIWNLYKQGLLLKRSVRDYLDKGKYATVYSLSDAGKELLEELEESGS